MKQLKNTILFDSKCNLCSKTVKRVMKLDKKKLFTFISNKSETGKNIISKNNLNSITTETIVLFTNENKFLIKSDAAISIVVKLNPLFLIFKTLYIIPKTVRDKVYDYVAKNRYKWFGENESCEITNEIY
tara:strand:- start:69 stop:458 length:390 start_codon:yes stop_codon:yes gene_type:complete